jgi:hypothetical protein
MPGMLACIVFFSARTVFFSDRAFRGELQKRMEMRFRKEGA